MWTTGWSRWAVLISSYRSTIDLVMIQIMSVKYDFILSLVSCLHSASDTSVIAGPGAEVAAEPAGPGQQPNTDTAGPQLPEACRLMTWHHGRTRSCQTTGNNNPSTSFSAIAKKLKLIYGHSVDCRAGCFKLKHFETLFWDTSSLL